MSSTFDHQAQLYSDLLSRASALKAQRQGGKAAPPPEGEPFGASHKLCFGALGLFGPRVRLFGAPPDPPAGTGLGTSALVSWAKEFPAARRLGPRSAHPLRLVLE